MGSDERLHDGSDDVLQSRAYRENPDPVPDSQIMESAEAAYWPLISLREIKLPERWIGWDHGREAS